MAENLWFLGHYNEHPQYYEKVTAMLSGIHPFFSNGHSTDYSYWGQLVIKSLKSYELAVVGHHADSFSREFSKHYFPSVIIQGTVKASSLPLLKNRFVAGKTLLYLCQNKVCKRPVESVEELFQQLIS